jgi:hypothetical protein
MLFLQHAALSNHFVIWVMYCMFTYISYFSAINELPILHNKLSIWFSYSGYECVLFHNEGIYEWECCSHTLTQCYQNVPPVYTWQTGYSNEMTTRIDRTLIYHAFPKLERQGVINKTKSWIISPRNISQTNIAINDMTSSFRFLERRITSVYLIWIKEHVSTACSQ